MVDQIAEEGNKLHPIARHLTVNPGLTYPAPSDADMDFIKNLSVPVGKNDYDSIFDMAIENVGQVWQTISVGVFNENDDYLTAVGNWSLDTGRNEDDRLVFWS